MNTKMNRSSVTRRVGHRVAYLAGSALCALTTLAPAACTPRTTTTAPQSAAYADPQTAGEVLAAVRTAVNADAIPAAGLTLSGSVDVYGVKGEVTFLFSPAGEYLMHMHGPLGRTDGFDGTTAWERTESGIGRVLPLTDRDERLTSYEFRTLGWLSPGSALVFELDLTKGETINLTFTRPGTSIHGMVVIDRKTMLPRSYTVMGGEETEVHTLTDYRSVEGVQIPHHVESKTEHAGITFDFTQGSKAPTFVRNPYEPVLALPDDFRFDPSASKSVDVRKAPTLHHLVKARIGDEEGWFIFDSGAGTEVLSTKFAERLKLERFGTIPVRGVGGVVESGFYQPATLTLGPLTIDRPVLVGLDLSMLDQYMGVEVAGIIGYGVLGRTVAVIDEAALKIELHDAASFKLEKGEWTDVLLYGRHPVVKGSLEGHEGYFRLDTGAANSTITVHAPTVTNFKMLEDRPVTATMFGGVGGMTEARAGQLRSLTLGGKTFQNFQAIFALPGKGAMDDGGTLGNIGGMLLQPFVLVFDYPHQRMSFIPRENADEVIMSLERPAK